MCVVRVRMSDIPIKKAPGTGERARAHPIFQKKVHEAEAKTKK